jgi:hypothetical protein
MPTSPLAPKGDRDDEPMASLPEGDHADPVAPAAEYRKAE